MKSPSAPGHLSIGIGLYCDLCGREQFGDDFRKNYFDRPSLQHCVPFYSSDPAAIWELIEEQKTNYAVSITKAGHLTTVEVLDLKSKLISKSTNSSFPVAACEAFLQSQLIL